MTEREWVGRTLVAFAFLAAPAVLLLLRFFRGGGRGAVRTRWVYASASVGVSVCALYLLSLLDIVVMFLLNIAGGPLVYFMLMWPLVAMLLCVVGVALALAGSARDLLLLGAANALLFALALSSVVKPL